MSKRESVYCRFESDELILRDVLARDRTILANERTLLAYFRTALMLGASGVTLAKVFVDEPEIMLVGYALFVFSVPLLVIGLVRYWSIRADMKKIIHRPSLRTNPTDT